MSIFNWFASKQPVAPTATRDSSGFAQDEVAGASRPPSEQPPMGSSRKAERLERRELIYSVVRDSMIRAGVLAASYKFKVLSLDARGLQYIIMMDLTNQVTADTVRLAEIEALIDYCVSLAHH